MHVTNVVVWCRHKSGVGPEHASKPLDVSAFNYLFCSKFIQPEAVGWVVLGITEEHSHVASILKFCLDGSAICYDTEFAESAKCGFVAG
jgi:hypothetical protein